LYLNIVECQNYLKTPAKGVICSTNASRFLLFWTENRSNFFHLSDKLQMTSELVTTYTVSMHLFSVNNVNQSLLQCEHNIEMIGQHLSVVGVMSRLVTTELSFHLYNIHIA